MVVKTIGLVAKSDSRVVAQADELERWLKGKQYRVVRQSTREPQYGFPRQRHNQAPEDLFCVVVLGGDGTFLSAVRWLGENQVPILGVKFGEVGFMAEAAEERLFAVVEHILSQPFQPSRGCAWMPRYGVTKN
jgi:NAD+ kinase